jgi:hypothetical protein
LRQGYKINALMLCLGETTMRVSAPLFLTLVPFFASAADIRVANYGVDAPACGSAVSPCRSITQAIEIAQAGDTVLVGPGRYGDINGDGDFTDAGDEHGDSAVITLARSGLRIISERGASVTLIDATGSPFTQVAVLIIARGTQFGAAGHGFRVLASDQIYGISVSGNEITVAGNVVTGGRQGSYSFPTRGRAILIADNVAIDNVDGTGFTGVDNIIDPGAGDRTRVLRNAAIRNRLGFNVAGPSLLFTDNVADDNFQGAMIGGDGATFRRNFVGSSHREGVILSGKVAAFLDNSVIGNRGPGVSVIGPVTQFSRNNIYGNGTSEGTFTGEPPNCGVYQGNRTRLNAPNNFWGAATGPGADPADAVCNLPNSTTVVAPVAVRPFAHVPLAGTP